MKGMLKLFLVTVVVLSFTGMSFAQATPAKPASPEKKTEMKAEKPKVTRVTGDVVSVDAKAGSLTVKVKDKDLNLMAESKAAKSALGKVKAGDKVGVSYTEKDGKMIASSITAVKAKAPAKAPAKMEEKKAETKGGMK